MTDLAFIRKLFGQTPLSQVWVGWHDGTGGFPGGPADKYLGRLPAQAGRYFSIGSMKPGKVSRKKADIAAIHAFVLDDIGSKATAVQEIVATFGAPTWIIETSQGNWQYGWVYDVPVGPSDFGRHAAAIHECHRRWGVDPAGADRNRAVRLPSGINVKPGRGNFVVRESGRGTPGARVSLVDIFMVLGLDWELSAQDEEYDLADLGKVSMADAERDIWVAALMTLGMALHDNPNGTIEIVCPWSGGHTDDRDGTAYLGDFFKCQHAHCAGHRTGDFKKEIRRRLWEDEGTSILELMVEMRPPAEQKEEEDYIAVKSLDHLFDPPPGGGSRAPKPGVLEGLTYQDEAEAVERLIYVQGEQVFLDEPTGAALTKTEVDEAFWKVPDAVSTKTGETMIRRGQKAVTNLLLTRSDLRKVHHRVYRPGLGKIIDDEYVGGLPAVNEWRAPTLKEGASGQWLKVILDHIAGRLFVGDAVEAEIWLDWSAALVQRPGEKCNWMPIIVGSGGTGKDLLFALYGKLVGPENLYITGSGLLTDRASFADAVKHKLIMVEELLGVGRKDMDNTLKPLVAAPPATIAVRGFRKGPEVTAKMCNLVAFTNNMDALAIGTESERRRYFIYESRAVALTADEGRELAEAVEKGAGEFLGFLMQRDLSKWNPYVKPITAATTRAADQMMVASMSGSAQKVLEIIEEGRLAGRDLILSSELTNEANTARLPAREAAHAIPEALHKAGFEKWAEGKQLWLSGGAQPRVWVRKGIAGVHGWDKDKMRDAIEAEQHAQTKALFDDKVVPFKK